MRAVEENTPMLVTVASSKNLAPQTPRDLRWGNFQFDFRHNARECDCNCDWLVVYDDVPGDFWSGVLTPPPEGVRAVLHTYEPSAVKIYGDDFAAQFSAVLTCHEDWALSHPRKIMAHPASVWLYRTAATYEQLRDMPPPPKSKPFSTICSTKQMRHTLHARRFAFTRKVKEAFPQMDWFGHGVQLIGAKEDGLDDYRAHLVVENHIAPGYWTEKLADAFLGWTLPVYCGAPDIAEYFPEQSFIPINIADEESAAAAVRLALREGEYEKRLPAIAEARRRVLEVHNFPALISRKLSSLSQTELPLAHNPIYRRRALWRKSPLGRMRYLADKARARARLLISLPAGKG